MLMDIENCPNCGSKLIKGSDYVRVESLGDFLLFGLSAPHHLWFNNDEKPKEELCIKGPEANKGTKCSVCGLMLIDPPLKPPTMYPEFPFIAGKDV